MKKRHHHVWEHYLRAWAPEGKIFCFQDGKPPFSTNPDNMAVESKFYRLLPTSDADIDFLRKVVLSESSPAQRAIHENFIKMFTMVFTLRKHLPPEALNVKVSAALDDIETNLEEDLHSMIEGDMIPVLSMLRSADASFIENDATSTILFYHFLSLQSLRTKGTRERIVKRRFANSPVPSSGAWAIALQMFAVNVGGSLYVNRTQQPIVFLHNRTQEPFITGDQPVVNLLHSYSSATPTAPKGATFYYPLSPWLALAIDEINNPCPWLSDEVTVERVRMLNEIMFKAAWRQTYGHTASAFDVLQSTGQA